MRTTNPILTGFNPDPSIVRVGHDYYIATSTFEWFPGVQIHHSIDLVNWTLIGHPLDDISKLDIRGVPDSCGVWAPCLTHYKGTFYLVYSAVRSFDGMYKDTPNYLITANNICGPWSEPTFLDASGFDGSLFHDDDGKKYFLSLLVDHRKGAFFGGIIIQEYDEQLQKLVGEKQHIFSGTELGVTEGPHIYKKDDYYYLLTAEGGTEYGHAATIARSKDLFGPYDLHPNNPLLSTGQHPSHHLQKTGHADLVFTEDDNCYIVFLTGRPLSERGRCTLGRESAIEEIEWRDGWPYISSTDGLPRLSIPSLGPKIDSNTKESINFSSDQLSIHYQTLRVPQSDNWRQYLPDKGRLRLIGRDSLTSTFDQSLLARRVQHFEISYQVTVDFQPTSFQQMAGLVCYYNTGHYFYLNISTDKNKRCINLVRCDNFEYTELTPQPIEIDQHSEIGLRVEWHHDKLTFFYQIGNNMWIDIKGSFDGSILSDDHVRDGSDRYRPAFTGSFVGFCCQDLTGQRHFADFLSCSYEEC